MKLKVLLFGDVMRCLVEHRLNERTNHAQARDPMSLLSAVVAKLRTNTTEVWLRRRRFGVSVLRLFTKEKQSFL